MLYEAAATTRSENYEAILKRLDSYITFRVRRLGQCYCQDIHPAVLDLELDEIAQRVRIKLWQALVKRDIHYPYAYIRLIIQNEYIDMKRRKKPYLFLSIDEELNHEEDEIAARHVTDPAETMAQQMDATTCLKGMVQAVLGLPPRQQYAMICSLKERVDDLKLLTEAFKLYKKDIQAIQWPAGRAEKQLLQASLAPAKKALAKSLGKSPLAC